MPERLIKIFIQCLREDCLKALYNILHYENVLNRIYQILKSHQVEVLLLLYGARSRPNEIKTTFIQPQEYSIEFDDQVISAYECQQLLASSQYFENRCLLGLLRRLKGI